jgi:hypothetical protein
MKALLVALMLFTSAEAFSPQEFEELTQGLYVESTTQNVSGRWITTTSYFGYFTTVRTFENSIQITVVRHDFPRYQRISIATELGEMVLLVKEWKDKIPIILYRNPNKILCHVAGEEEL